MAAPTNRLSNLSIDPTINLFGRLWPAVLRKNKMAARPEGVCETQTWTSDSCSGGQTRSEKYVHFTFWHIFRKKQNGGLTGSGSSHAKTKTGFVLRRSWAFWKTCFYFILTYFDENTKWREDDVIPETVNINGSVSSAIPDIPLTFNTFDRNFEKIQLKLRPPQCRLKEIKNMTVTSQNKRIP